VAPESPGDLFDATEIDEILTLRTMALTEREKREARATDERAAAIIDRADTIPPELLERLHGAVRQLRPVSGPSRPPAQPVPSPPGSKLRRPRRPCPRRALSIGPQRSSTDNHGRSLCPPS
jgi:hypothetical protein